MLIMNKFDQQYARLLLLIEQALPQALPEQAIDSGGLVVDAARYSLLAGGKRVRPILTLATAELLGLDISAVMPFALAIEMIHTYSLIHDDLPCMDDDDLRRGRPTCHKVYGEATAVLAGDTLLNSAYEVMLSAADPAVPQTIYAAQLIARSAGSRGMIGGQALDLAAEKNQIDGDSLKRLHQMKTGALLSAPVLTAAVMARAEPEIYSRLEQFSAAIGLAFQIQDDILDVTANSEQMGKTTGKDERDRKSTYVSLYGLDGARTELDQAINQAKQSLSELKVRYNLDTGFLNGLSDFLLNRKN